ncbi:MAG: nuclear transport factor 2 family protein [Rhodospirillaceae bacterium]
MNRVQILSIFALTFLIYSIANYPVFADDHAGAAATLAAVKRQSEAFINRDVDALVANMAQDFTAYRMTNEGPEAVIRNRAQAAEMLSKTFTQGSRYLESEISERIIVKDIAVQVELDTFRTSEGTQTSTTLAIYHVKDGKMWRSYNFRLPD